MPVAGTYSGLFPCENCPGIETRLWLRSDGTFFTRRRYLAEDGQAPVTAYNLGRWRLAPDGSAVVLDGRGPVRAYRRAGAGRLELETDSVLEHRLDREAGAGPPNDVLRMTGLVSINGEEAWFSECRSGLRAAIVRSGDFRRLLHQYRTAGAPGEAARVELEGRFSWAADGAPNGLVIERLVAVTGRSDCPGSGAAAPTG